MKKIGFLWLLLLIACSPVKTVDKQYQLVAFASQLRPSHGMHRSILISPPEAAAGYQSAQMIYIKKPYELNAFASHAWIEPPADMLYPLIVQSIQQTGAFRGGFRSFCRAFRLSFGYFFN
jgi:cholesterol transport system auxiliary component